MDLAGEFGDEFALAATMDKINQFPGLFTTTEVAESLVDWKNEWMHIKSTADGEKNVNQPVESCSQRQKRRSHIHNKLNGYIGIKSATERGDN